MLLRPATRLSPTPLRPMPQSQKCGHIPKAVAALSSNEPIFDAQRLTRRLPPLDSLLPIPIPIHHLPPCLYHKSEIITSHTSPLFTSAATAQRYSYSSLLPPRTHAHTRVLASADTPRLSFTVQIPHHDVALVCYSCQSFSAPSHRIAWLKSFSCSCLPLRPKPSAWENRANKPGHLCSAHHTPNRPSFHPIPIQTIFQAPHPHVLHLPPDPHSATRRAPTTFSPSVVPGPVAGTSLGTTTTTTSGAGLSMITIITISISIPFPFPRRQHLPPRIQTVVPLPSRPRRWSADPRRPPRRRPVILRTPRTPAPSTTIASPFRLLYQQKFGPALSGTLVSIQRTSTSDLTMRRTITITSPYSPTFFSA